MSKIITLAAAATGYVLGSRAGRQRYEQISAQAQKLWQDPRVQRAAADAKETAAAKAPVVKDKVSQATSKVTGGKVGGSNGSSDAGTTATPPATPVVTPADDPMVAPGTTTTVSSPGNPTV